MKKKILMFLKEEWLPLLIIIFLILWATGVFDKKEIPIKDPAVTESVISNLIQAGVDTRLTHFGLIRDNKGGIDASHLELKAHAKTENDEQNIQIAKAKKLPKPAYYGGDVKKLEAKDKNLDQLDKYLQNQINELETAVDSLEGDFLTVSNFSEADAPIDWAVRWGAEVKPADSNTGDWAVRWNTRNLSSNKGTYSSVNDETNNYKWVDHIGGSYGITVGGIGYIKKNLVDITNGSNPSFMCEYTNWTDGGASMTLQGDYYICNTGHQLKPEEKSKLFAYCIFIGNSWYLPHELIKLGKLSSSDYQANNQGGFNFMTMPTGELIINGQ